MPYHPFVDDTEQGRLTVAARQEQQSQYGLGLSKDFLVTGISTFTGAVSLEGGISGSVQIPDGIRDSEDGIGGSGQVLSSTGSGLAWINTSAANVGSATSVGINLNTTDADQWLVFAGANSGNNVLRVNNTIRVNPSTGRIGIGTEDPLDQLHIHQVGDNAPKLRIVGVSSNPELNFISPSTGAAVIKFSDDNDAAGSITYDHPHNKMKFMIGTTLSFWVSPNAHLRLFEALEDATGQAGVAGSVFSSTGSKTAWLPQSSIAAGTATTATNAQGIIGSPNITVTDITIGGKLKDGDSNFGTSGQVLSSDGTNTQWINVGSVAAGSASTVAITAASNNADHHIVFADTTSGIQGLQASTGLKVNPSTNSITASSFVKASNSGGFLKADGTEDTSTYLTSAGTSDKIEEGNTKAEVIDGGTNGHFVVTTEGEERLRVVSDGRIGIGTDAPNNLTRVSIQMPTAGGAGAITVQSNSVGAGNTNIVLRSIDNNGGNWADAEFRAEGYSFKIRTTERLRIDFDGTVSDSMGPLRSLGANTQSGAYTLVAGDAGKYVAQSTNSASVTVPNGVFSAGNMVTIVNLTATNINIVQGAGLDLNFTADGTTGTRTLGAKGACTILFVSSGISFISGSGLS